MITPERVYEVFGIDGNLEEGNNGTLFIPHRIAVDDWDFELVIDGVNPRFKPLFKSSPEMLVVLVNIIYNFEKFCHIVNERNYETDYTRAIKAIESADSQNRSWVELKKELEE